MFVDKVQITVKSGDGGDGIVSFLHFKGVVNGGPDGGDGGRGGDVYFVGDKRKTSLADFYYKRKFSAENGAKGGSKNCTGKAGEPLKVIVPLGTVIRDAETNRILCDIFYDGQEQLVLKGGEGGKGNARFINWRRHAPHFSQKGEKTPVRTLVMELKTIADVGLIGFPNVGKSTTLSVITNARPKIANYHFTTLSPNLGVADYYGDPFVVADIPGLIEGAADGAGLGHDFLRHIERTRMLVHVVDVSGEEGRDPVDDYKKINAELKKYSKILAGLPQIVVGNKCETEEAEENFKRLKRSIRKYPVMKLSAVLGEGIPELKHAIYEKLQTLPPVEPIEFEPFTYEEADPSKFTIDYDKEDNVYVVTGPFVEVASRNITLNDYQSLSYFQKLLREKGIIKKLRQMGAVDGDTVIIGDVEFEFTE
jgi:GTP-binding protein